MKTASNPSDHKTTQPLAAEFNLLQIRQDFPVLKQTIRGKPLVYLDNAATTQKPQCVMDAIVGFYAFDCSNVHRGVHELSRRATESYEGARLKVQKFLNAAESREIIFVRGATEGINLVAHSFLRPTLQPGDEILISAMEHHSNIVPWQMLCEERGAILRVAPINDLGELIMEAFEQLLSPRTRLVAITHVSNALGTITPIRHIISLAHGKGVPVLVDGAQAVAHMPVDVQELDCDFYVFSGHKLYGPTGIGVLYGNSELLEKMVPFQGGGDMISSVTFEKTTYNTLPYKFEAGTPNIAATIGLGAAIDYVSAIGLKNIAAHEHQLLAYATEAFARIPGVRLIGTASKKAAVLSFLVDGVHPHDIGTILDQDGVAIRAGHHCAQPVMARFGIPATTRASFGVYNTTAEIDALVAGIYKVKEIMG
ncbi:MAG: cysteine desulfurase [Kiritimatiellae bacterium]|nr:cysteine desulfurase [Kiritimatiellia bacterium]